MHNCFFEISSSFLLQIATLLVPVFFISGGPSQISCKSAYICSRRASLSPARSILRLSTVSDSLAFEAPKLLMPPAPFDLDRLILRVYRPLLCLPLDGLLMALSFGSVRIRALGLIFGANLTIRNGRRSLPTQLPESRCEDGLMAEPWLRLPVLCKNGDMLRTFFLVAVLFFSAVLRIACVDVARFFGNCVWLRLFFPPRLSREFLAAEFRFEPVSLRRTGLSCTEEPRLPLADFFSLFGGPSCASGTMMLYELSCCACSTFF